MKIILRKKNLCLSDNFEIFVRFEISAIFEFSNDHFGEIAKNIGYFFRDFWCN